MTDTAVRQQIHGYRNGHQLIDGTVTLGRNDQDVVDRLSDIAGPLRPGETFAPYLTAYPLPSGDYYVLARTWQDTTAPRAGCVITRSLLVPMPMWQGAKSVREFVHATASPPLGKPLRAQRETTTQSSLSDPRTAEIVEALFLEARRPVVVFDSPDSEEISIRILTALWPARRLTFAACTWCLGPRKISGREFDLAFAPADARRRFSDWPGRRVDPSNHAVSPRHRWTKQLLQEIFSGPDGALGAGDDLGVLSDQQGDEGALRLSLMWRELEGKAESTPNAVLGMLDILNSRGVSRRVAQSRLEPLAINAVQQAMALLPPIEIMGFFLNLLRKYPTRLPSPRLLRELQSASRALAMQSPDDVLNLLRASELAGQNLPAILAAGFGDGLAKHALCDHAHMLDHTVDPAKLLALLAYSRDFCIAVSCAVDACPTKLLRSVSRALALGEPRLRARARRHLIPLMRSPNHAAILTQLLRDVEADDLSRAVTILARNGALDSETFDAPLLDAATAADAVGSLRTATMEVGPTASSERLIAASLRLNPADVRWTLATLSGTSARRMLVDLVARSTDAEIAALGQSSSIIEELLGALLKVPVVDAVLVHRLLIGTRLPPELFLSAASQVFSALPAALRGPLAVMMLEHGLLARRLRGVDVDAVFKDAFTALGARRLVNLLTAADASPVQVCAFLNLAVRAPAFVRDRVVETVGVLSARLALRNPRDLGEGGYLDWAALLDRAKSVAPSIYLKTSAEVLPIALKRVRDPASPLVTASFPVIYKQLIDFEKAHDLRLPLMFVPFALFLDLDRPKTARNELVDAFMDSRWPPSDLWIAAQKAGIGQKVLKRVASARGGSRYLDRMARDADRLKPNQAKALRDALSKLG